jgi:hypothetical protein
MGQNVHFEGKKIDFTSISHPLPEGTKKAAPPWKSIQAMRLFLFSGVPN